MWDTKNIHSDIVAIRYIDKVFTKGTKVIIQPHTSNFLDIENHRDFLELYMNNYTVLQKNTTIMLPNPSSPLRSNIYLNIIETKPDNIISTVDTDLEIDFKAPLDYKEPEPKPAPIATDKNDDNVKYYNHDFMKKNNEKKNKTNTFESFSGKGSRLGGD
jgi:ubiquitin fusion degradation protein 1